MKQNNNVNFRSALYFQTPIWTAEVPMFLRNAIKVTDKYIKKSDKLLKDRLKNEPKWRQDLGDFGLSKQVKVFQTILK